MKKLLVVILLLVHTLASGGVVLSTHYCMGHYAGVSMGESDQDACGTCGMTDGSCCHDQVTILKIDYQDLVKSRIVEFPSYCFSPSSVFQNRSENTKNYQNFVLVSKGFSPPPIYLLNRNFRI